MALNALSDISAALVEVLAPELERQINRKAVLLSLLSKSTGRGPNCTWDVQFSGASAAAFAEGADVGMGDFDHDVEKMAVLAWGGYRSSFAISGLAQRVAASARNVPAALTSLVAERGRGSAAQLASSINTELYVGDGTSNSLVGLEVACAATGSYAGLSKATHSEWAGNTDGNSNVDRDLTKDLLDEMDQAIYTACGEMPNVIVCSPGVARKYSQLFDDNVRFAPPAGELSAAGGVRAPQGGPPGFTGYSYKGIPIYRDKDCPAGKLFMLNTDYIELQSLRADAEGNTGAGGGGMSMSGDASGIAVDYQFLAKTGDSNKFSFVTNVAMKVTHPNALGLIEDIKET